MVYKQAPNGCTSKHSSKQLNPIAKAARSCVALIIYAMCLAATKQWDILQTTSKSQFIAQITYSYCYFQAD